MKEKSSMQLTDLYLNFKRRGHIKLRTRKSNVMSPLFRTSTLGHNIYYPDMISSLEPHHFRSFLLDGADCTVISTRSGLYLDDSCNATRKGVTKALCDVLELNLVYIPDLENDEARWEIWGYLE
jgi:hypothetical protein